MLLAACSRLLGCPVKWIEDRLEHLTASSTGADRADGVEAAFSKDGELLALKFNNIVNVGAFVRALNRHRFTECIQRQTVVTACEISQSKIDWL